MDQGAVNAVYSGLDYPSKIPVRVEASYLMPPSYPFRMFFKIEFERAVAEMDFWRPKGEQLKIFPRDGEMFFPDLEEADAYREEIDYFARQLKSGEKFELAPLEESIQAVEICLASEQSFRSGRPVRL